MRRLYPGHQNFLLVTSILALLTACAAPPANLAPPTAISTPPATLDPLFQSDGGGDPRGSGYWLVWNNCTEDNQSATAKANGGRAAGWILLDDLLTEPGIMLGPDEVTACEQAAAILQGKTSQDENRDDHPYGRMAVELLTAQLNLAIPSESCPAVLQAVQTSQLLLVSWGYQLSEDSFVPKVPQKDRQLAEFLAAQLEKYNLGELCH